MLNRTCRTGPLAGIHDLHSTASSQSKVSQSTVMPCLTDYSLFSRFKALQLQWRGPSNRTSRTKYNDVFRFLQSSWQKTWTQHGLEPTTYNAWKATVHWDPWERKGIARIYIHPAQRGIIQGTGMWKESAENIHRKMHIPPAYGGACSSRHDCFQFSWRMGVGGRK